MAASGPFVTQIQNRNYLSGIGFKFNLAKYPKVDFFSNSARIPELSLAIDQQPTYLKDIDVPGEKLTYGDFTLRFLVDENLDNILSLSKNFAENKIDLIIWPESALQIDLLYFENNPISIELPNFVDMKVILTDNAVKGDTTQGATKKATLQTGIIINVPLFVNNDDLIKIDTRTSEYIGRA